MPAASRFAVSAALLLFPLLGPSPVAAQDTPRGTRGAQPLQRELFSTAAQQALAPGRDADSLRNEFRELMRHYPPSLGEVMKLDPTLMGNTAYLRSYPGLEAFFAAHPEIPRNPTFFLNFARTAADIERDNSESRYTPELRQRQDVITFLGVGAVVAGIALALLTLIRTFLAHRRWLRASKLQIDLHSRLVDRLSSSADVHAFLESAASNRLLAELPATGDGSGRAASAPLGRILWSVQAGIVLTFAGIGLLIGRSYVPGTSELFTVPGILAIAIGTGFVLAAVASYILSNQLGLMEPVAASAVRPRVRSTDEPT